MLIANLTLYRMLVDVSHTLYICNQNLQTAMDKEDFGGRNPSFSCLPLIRLIGATKNMVGGTRLPDSDAGSNTTSDQIGGTITVSSRNARLSKSRA